VETSGGEKGFLGVEGERGEKVGELDGCDHVENLINYAVMIIPCNLF
jgi:hypothetical protein